ncbi:MAG TPA: hypothetical protein G4O00_07285 [Thermoflexia bacterium]|jgi:hypothetical protein|nr:hypothetical protein [Thermoflexia bacterium]
MGQIKLSWQRLPSDYLYRTAACLVDGQDEPIAVVFNPLIARPVAAILNVLIETKGGWRGRLDDARADLAHSLAERLGLEEERVLEALDWAVRRAGVEVIPDEIEVQIKDP